MEHPSSQMACIKMSYTSQYISLPAPWVLGITLRPTDLACCAILPAHVAIPDYHGGALSETQAAAPLPWA